MNIRGVPSAIIRFKESERKGILKDAGITLISTLAGAKPAELRNIIAQWLPKEPLQEFELGYFGSVTVVEISWNGMRALIPKDEWTQFKQEVEEAQHAHNKS